MPMQSQKTVNQVLEEVLATKRRVEDMQRSGVFYIPHPIDEYSVLWGNGADQRDFRDRAPAGGLQLFNESDDYMSRMDDATDRGFYVHFDFLRTWPEADWRIESMFIREGNAPLHEETMQGNPDYCGVFHASYKLADHQAYYEELRRLEACGMTMAAEYQNGYGRFSYWMVEPSLPWFKPRINLRDVPPFRPSVR